MPFQVIKEYNCNDFIVLGTSSNYEAALRLAIEEAKESSSSYFHDEIRDALEDRGYYMCGWSSTKILIEEK